MKHTVLALVWVLMAGCAYSPQQITIRPDVRPEGERYGEGRSVLVTAEDQRAVKVIGTRGGLYAETSTISVANSLTDAVAQAASAKLAAQGFSINSLQTDAVMNIIIDEISYDVPESKITKTIKLAAKLRVELNSGDKTYTGQYQTQSEQQALVSPSAEKNEKLINDLLSKTLQRVFVDPKVVNFLSQIQSAPVSF